MITIREIAKLAGVSRGTVDRVINGRGGVAKEAEDRILEIIREHGYKPNRAAKALARRNRSFLIGVVSASIDNKFFKDVVAGIEAVEKEIRELGIRLLYREVAKFSVDDQLRCLDELLESNIDALAINPINDPLIIEKLREANRRAIPVITFNSDVEQVDKLSYIGCDYHKSGRIAAGLIGMACRESTDVAIVTGSMKSLGHSLRVDGFRDALQAFPALRLDTIVEMFDDEITSYSKVGKLLADNPNIGAFFFSAGGKEGGVRAIQESGRRATIVTVDIDPLSAEWLKTGVIAATICQQPYVQGYEAIRQLAGYLLYGEVPARKMQYTQAEIIIPQSL